MPDQNPDQNAHRPGADLDPDSESFPFPETEQGDETAPEDDAGSPDLEPETGDETAPEGELAQSRRRLRCLRLAVIGVILLCLLALVTLTVSAISLIRVGDSSPEVSCDPVERIDLGGPADDFTVTIGETTGTALKRDGTITSTESSPGEAVYEGIDPATGKKVTGEVEYTAGHISWSTTDGDTSYLQVSKCSDEDGNVVSERKLQVFVARDAKATSEKSISISTEG